MTHSRIFQITFLLTINGLTQVWAQQFTDVGMFATGIASRTRLGGSDFHLGDLLYVTAFQPANSGSMYVSAHMEYLNGQNTWQPVPTAGTALGKDYRSGAFAGVRDYVWFGECTTNTTRHVSLFVPYDAASLPINKVYKRRYSLRIWDRMNKPIKRVILDGDTVSTGRDDNGRFVIVAVKAETCSLPNDPGHLEPNPQSVDVGTFRYFSTRTGAFGCPAAAPP